MPPRVASSRPRATSHSRTSPNFVWPPPDDTFHGAIRKTAARRDAAQGAKPQATTLVFFGAKGGAGTTTVAVNCGVEIARLSQRLAYDFEQIVCRPLYGTNPPMPGGVGGAASRDAPYPD